MTPTQLLWLQTTDRSSAAAAPWSPATSASIRSFRTVVAPPTAMCGTLVAYVTRSVVCYQFRCGEGGGGRERQQGGMFFLQNSFEKARNRTIKPTTWMHSFCAAYTRASHRVKFQTNGVKIEQLASLSLKKRCQGPKLLVFFKHVFFLNIFSSCGFTQGNTRLGLPQSRGFKATVARSCQCCSGKQRKPIRGSIMVNTFGRGVSRFRVLNNCTAEDVGTVVACRRAVSWFWFWRSSVLKSEHFTCVYCCGDTIPC